MTAHDLALLIWAALFAALGYSAWAAVGCWREGHRTDKTLPIDRAQSRSQLMPPTPYDDYLPLVYPEHVRAEFGRIKTLIDLALWETERDPNEESR